MDNESNAVSLIAGVVFGVFVSIMIVIAAFDFDAVQNAIKKTLTDNAPCGAASSPKTYSFNNKLFACVDGKWAIVQP